MKIHKLKDKTTGCGASILKSVTINTKLVTCKKCLERLERI
jgi:hypothetical protein